MSKVVNVSAEGARNVAITRANALIKTRVFTKAQGDAEGNLLSPYKSNSYVDKRQDKGLRVDYKDLEFTGTLRNSIKPIFKKDRTNLEITPVQYPSGKTTQQIAKYQEDYQGERIFSLTEGELQTTLDAFEFQFKKEFKKLTSA